MPEVLPVDSDAQDLRLLVVGRAVRILLKVRWWHLVAVFLIATLYWLVPDAGGISTKDIEALAGPEFLTGARQAVSGKHGIPPSPELVVSVNPLVRGIITVGVSWNDQGLTSAQAPRIKTELRAENLILMWGLCLGAIIALASAKPERLGRSSDHVSTPVGPRLAAAPRSTDSTTAEQTLADDVAAAASRAADVYRRSTFLLAGGILMAFVGVSVFAVTIPTNFMDELSLNRSAFQLDGERASYLASQDLLRRQNEARPTESADARMAATIDALQRSYAAQQSQLDLLQRNQLVPPSPYPALLGRAMRPFGMLIFVEGIAWFLLRQYRSLIEDYKGFVRIQLRRSSYLIALRAASSVQAGTPSADVIRTLLSEDLTGRLGKDQTTEALEAMKVREDGPILESMKELKDLIKSKVPGLS